MTEQTPAKPKGLSAAQKNAVAVLIAALGLGGTGTLLVDTDTGEVITSAELRIMDCEEARYIMDSAVADVEVRDATPLELAADIVLDSCAAGTHTIMLDDPFADELPVDVPEPTPEPTAAEPERDIYAKHRELFKAAPKEQKNSVVRDCALKVLRKITPENRQKCRAELNK